MRSAPRDPLIEVRAGTSVRHFILALFCYLLALLALLLTSLNFFYSFLLFAALTAYATHYYRLRLKKSLLTSVLAIRWQNNCWFIETSKGWQPCWPKGEWLVLPWLMCLSFRGEDERNYSVNFFADSDHPAALHALRLRLLLMGKGQR
ncbi:MAG: protein YgfX [Endozoicomonas sp.]|uniref:protein YgfX n=1 Tax=Endozoicomonas sp. TaxID=1892382 RepID=UPI003D9BF04E